MKDYNVRARVFKVETIFDLGEMNKWLDLRDDVSIVAIEFNANYMIVFYENDRGTKDVESAGTSKST